MTQREPATGRVKEAENPSGAARSPVGVAQLRYETWCTRRLRAEPLSRKHWAQLLALYGDPGVAEGLRSERGEEFLQRRMPTIEAHWAHRGWGPWALFSRERSSTQNSPQEPAGSFVGQALLRWRDLAGEWAVEIGYVLMPAFWGRGIATEAARAMGWFALEVLRLEEVVAFARVDHHASRRVLEKIGMSFERTFELRGLETALYRMKAGELISGQRMPIQQIPVREAG